MANGCVGIVLTHWGRVTHICISKLTIIGSDNGLLPGWHQAIIWTNTGILLIAPIGTNFSGILIKIHAFSFKKMHLNMSYGKWRPFYLSFNVLTLVMLRHNLSGELGQHFAMWPPAPCVTALSHSWYWIDVVLLFYVKKFLYPRCFGFEKLYKMQICFGVSSKQFNK